MSTREGWAGLPGRWGGCATQDSSPAHCPSLRPGALRYCARTALSRTQKAQHAKHSTATAVRTLKY